MKNSLTLITLFVLAISFQAQAKPGFLKQFKAQYPKSKLNDCVICHIAESEENERNSYGADLETTLKNNKLDFKAVEALDSDGDGATNLEEINAGTQPGDKSSVPVTGLVTPKV